MSKSNTLTGWAKTPWGVKPKAEKVNESPTSHPPAAPPFSTSSSSSTGSFATKSSRSKDDVWDEITHSSLKKSSADRGQAPQQQTPQYFIPNNSIEDALKVSYRKDLTPPPQQKQKMITPTSTPASSSNYSSAVHLNHKKNTIVSPHQTTPPSSSTQQQQQPLYHEGSKLKAAIKPTEKHHHHNLFPPHQLRQTTLSEQLHAMRHLINEEEEQQQGEQQKDSSTAAAMITPSVMPTTGTGADHASSLSNNDTYLNQVQNESEIYQSDTEEDDKNESIGEEVYNHYQSDDESDALRSLPLNPPFLNTELSSDFETEYEENDPLQDLLPQKTLSKNSRILNKKSSKGSVGGAALQRNNPTALAYAGNPFGPLAAPQPSGGVPRKMRSQSPYETPQTIKVQDNDSEGFPVSKQKRPTPEKPLPPQSQSQLSSTDATKSPSSISDSRSGDDAIGRDLPLPPPPPPPQPRVIQSSPLGSSFTTSEFDNDLLIDGTEITLTHKIGEGFFGEVWKAKWNHTQDIAVKKMKHEATNPNDRNTFFSEVYSLAKLRHPNITIFYGVTSPPDAYIISELLSSSLFQLIHGYKSDPTPLNLMFPLPVILRILRDVASGGAYLHKRKPPIIHRDLSSSNVLLSVSPTSSPEELLRACADENRPVAKLTDFGLSRNVDWYMTSCVGNLFYLAPEVFSGDHYTQSADVYSYGILIWELVSRVSPYPSESPQRAAFLAATRGLRPSHMTTDSRTPPDLAYLREKCWHGDPMERPTFHDVLSKLGEMMLAVSGGKSGVHELPPLPDNSSEGQYSDQFSTAPIETLTHLWDRRCRQLSRLLLQKPKVEQLVQRRILLSHPDPNFIPRVAQVSTVTPLKAQKKSITIPQQLAKQRLVPKSKK